MKVNDRSIDSEKQLADLKEMAAELSRKYNPKKPKKSLQKIYDFIHDRYFIKYVENPVFGDIFSNGTYNCVTASALYAFLFDEMKIPYEIREMPTHVYVYIVAYPGPQEFTVESTLPAEGILDVREKDVESLKKEFIANKLITVEEAKTEDFAQKYLLADTTITLSNLYGIQLYNHSLSFSIEGKYRQAAEVLETALLYHQKLYIRQTMMVNLAMMLRDASLSVEDKCFVTTKSYKLFDELGFDPLQETLATLNEMIPEDVTEKIKATELQELADCIEAAAIDTVLTHKIRSSANKVNAFYHYSRKEIDEALFYLIRNAKSENQSPWSLTAEIIGRHLYRVTNMEDGLDSLAKYEAIFPFIKQDYDVQGVGAYFYLRLVYEHVELDELQEAFSTLKAFEDRYKPDDKVNFDPAYIGFAYGAISSHFVRAGNEEEAKDYLKRGMKYAKDSLELRRKLKLLESDSW